MDQPFLDKYCVGYDEKTLPAGAPENGHYKAYILGEGDDGVAKTPQWASRITGIPADRIIKLARDIGMIKPAYICQGWGPQRQANGELSARAIAMLPILTGNVGINGGNSGARESTYTITIERLPVLENPVKTAISCFTWTDAIARGPEMTATRDGVRGKEKLDVPIKFLWNYAGNALINQHSDINKTHDILQDESKCETIVVIDNFMTSSAKYADLLLPDLMTVEQEDIIPNDYAGNMGYLIFIQPATSAKFERKPIYWILSEVAKRLGDDVYQRFTEGRTQAQWLQHLYAKMVAKDPALPAYEELKRMGIYKRKDPNGHFVAYRDFRRDPEAHPLNTPSGKIEIYSSRLAEIAARWQLEKDDVISPLPVYASTFEGWDDPLRSQYPLQLFGFHYKARTHSSYGNVDVLQAACRHVGGNITRSSPSASPVARLMNCYGGSLNQYGTYSTAQIACAMPYTYGSNDGNSTSDIENSKLVVMFGNNPAETRMSGGGITWYLEQARERSNARMIVIDPRYTDTAAGREDEWIPIRPGTDAALVAGIAWV